jgi:protein-tyrosine-phosphatase
VEASTCAQIGEKVTNWRHYMTADDRQKPLLKRVLRPLAPKRLLAERAIFLRLGPRAGRNYLTLRILDAAGFRSSNQRRIPEGARSFVFVCYGNIMRSPMTERMLTRALAERGVNGITVRSAGIHAVPGSEAHPRAQVVARELGLPLDSHRSRLLTTDMVSEADAILAMDFQNKAELLAKFPQAKNKIFMLGAYAPVQGASCEIADPYFGDQDEARRCYRVLQMCIDNLAESLWPKRLQEADEVGRSGLTSTRI